MPRVHIIKVNPEEPEEDAIAAAAEVIRRGGLVAFPTETVYGLGANALDPSAVRRIFAAKGRPATNPVIVHVADSEGARRVATQWPDSAALLSERFWPGPLTFVLPKRPEVPDEVTAGGPTVAVRAPSHPVALALIRAAGVPIAAPSANRSTRLSPTRAEHVEKSLGARIDLIVDGGPTPGGVESTVLDLTVSPPRLLRPGLVTPAELESVVGPIAIGGAPDSVARSPGLVRRHYAPRTRLECVEGSGEARVRALCAAGHRVAWMMFSITVPPDGFGSLPQTCAPVPSPVDSRTYAANLYDTLHRLDEGRFDAIVVELPPDTPEWLAVRDRLNRACAR